MIGITSYSDSHLLTLINLAGTMIASLFPISAIIVLSFITKMPVRLGVVAIFTAAFSLSLSLVTHARRIEIFAATAA